MVLQCKATILLFHLPEILCRIAFQQFIGIFIELQFFQPLLESLHLLQVLYSVQMTLNQWYNGVVSYWWPDQSPQIGQEQPQNESMSVIARLKRLRSLMKDSNYSQQCKEQLCNFYSQLIKEYPQARSTMKYPTFLHEPEVYTPKVSFQIGLSINMPDTKGALQLVITFPEELPTQMPLFFIKNPNYDMCKPNKKHVIFGSADSEEKYFEAVMGGVRVLFPANSNERWQWTPSSYYKQQNIVNMVRWIHKQLIPDHFPFIKRKKEKFDLMDAQAKRLKEHLNKTVKPSEEQVIEVPLLSNIQQLCALQKSISLEISSVYQEIEQLKRVQQESGSWDIKEFLPQPSDQRSQVLLESVSSLNALRDTVYILQMKLNGKQIDLRQFMRMGESLFRAQLEERRRISFWQLPQIL